MKLRAPIGTLVLITSGLLVLAGAFSSHAVPPSVAQHDLRWYVHSSLETPDRPLSYWEELLTQATAEGNVLLEGASGPADTPCCARLESVEVEFFDDLHPERDLYQIHDSAEWNDLLLIGGSGSKAFLVDSIFYCGSSATVLGCGQTTSDCSLFPENAGMDRIMVVSLAAYEIWDRLSATITHEKGHNSCLGHSNDGVEDNPDSCNLMRSSDGGACLTSSQCDAFVAAANGTSSLSCGCHTASGSLAPDSTACTTDEGTPGICSGGYCGEAGSDASATLFAPVGTAADFADSTDEWMSLSALTGNWTESFPLGSGIEPAGFAYSQLRNRIFAVAPSGSNLNDLYSINPTTGVVSLVGSMTDFEEMVALAFDPGSSTDLDDDRLLALAIRTGVTNASGSLTICRTLVAIDPDDASATALGHINQGCTATSPGLTGLAYDSNREKLYAASFFSTKLWEISLTCSPYCLATGIDDCVLKDSCPDDFYLGRTYPGLAYSAGNDRLYLIGQRGTSGSNPRTELDTFNAETLRKTETLNIDGFSFGGLAAAPNPLPADVDGDGQNDAIDNCPTISNEDQLDTDADLVGDACDDDDDADGTLDSEDAFPLDPDEQLDTDGDAVGNNSDDDDDADNWEDEDEIICGTDPLDATSFPADADGDGDCDAIETDADDDDWSDVDEVICGSDPLDAGSNPADTDEDEVCDVVDTDDDGDGWSDADEGACGTDPLDEDSRPLDTDDDATCDLFDDDDDGDGWTDASEPPCDKDPLDDRSTPIDSDFDGICNFIETDDDNDDWADTEEATCGTDPIDAASTPVDTDLDEVCNAIDEDDDADNWADTQETACGTDPLDPTSIPDDYDADLECDVIDLDDDNDTWLDVDEIACGSSELDAASIPLDHDGDLSCDSLDLDDDNDNWSDVNEAACNTDEFDNTSIPADLDGDLLCDLVDTDDDGDGFSDEAEIAAGTDPRDETVFPAPEPSPHLLGGMALLCLSALRRRRPRTTSDGARPTGSP